MKIESYRFGEVVVNGEVYRSDVIVFPDSVRSGWWRIKGHHLDIRDLDEVIDAVPQVLIIGKGHDGRMVVPVELVKELNQRGIEVLVFRTEEACKVYNEISRKKKTIAAMHLTC